MHLVVHGFECHVCFVCRECLGVKRFMTFVHWFVYLMLSKNCWEETKKKRFDQKPFSVIDLKLMKNRIYTAVNRLMKNQWLQCVASATSMNEWIGEVENHWRVMPRALTFGATNSNLIFLLFFVIVLIKNLWSFLWNTFCVLCNILNLKFIKDFFPKFRLVSFSLKTVSNTDVSLFN